MYACHRVLAPCGFRRLRHKQQGSFASRALPCSTLCFLHEPIRHLSRLRSTSRLSRLWQTDPGSGDFRAGTRRASPVARVMSLPPCCRFHPAEVKEPHRSDFGSPTPPSALRLRTRPSGLRTFEATFAFTVVTARDFVVSPEGDVVDRLQSLGFPPPLLSKPTGLLTLCPGRYFLPVEHASLPLDTQPNVRIARILFSIRFTPSSTTRRARGSHVRARSARRGARVDRSRPFVARLCAFWSATTGNRTAV